MRVLGPLARAAVILRLRQDWRVALAVARARLGAGPPGLTAGQGSQLAAGVISALRERLGALILAPARLAPGGAALLYAGSLAAGAALHLSLNADPGWPLLGLAAAVGLGGLAGALASLNVRAGLLMTLACVAAGFLLTEARVGAVAAPRIAEDAGPVELTGWVERIDAGSPARRRYVVRVVEWGAGDTVPEGAAPRRVRISARLNSASLGDTIRVRALLNPPPGPASPGAYSFARTAYFQQLGGVGRALSPFTLAPDAKLGPREGAARALTRLRAHLSDRLTAAGGPRNGPIIAALVTGDRSNVTAVQAEDLRLSGLGHILAISGLHMALVGGGAFFLVSLMLASIEPLARRANVRKPAAAVALLVAVAYLALSGASVSAQRAFVMAAVAFGAVLLDRRALSLHAVALAAVIVLVLAPESAVSPGFQMSFAATAGLISANDALRNRSQLGGADVLIGPMRKFVVSLAMTSLIAGLATAPFAAFHFNRVAPAGFVANLAAMPVFSLLVMPSAGLAAALTPFGLEAAPARVGGWGMDVVFAIARAAAEPERRAAPIEAGSGPALALICAGVLVACALRSGRARALTLLAAGFGAWGQTPNHQIWIGEAGGVAVVAGRTGVYRGPSSERFAAEVFLRRAGALAPTEESTAAHCDLSGCAFEIEGRRVLVLDRLDALLDDCAGEGGRPDLVLARASAPARLRRACEPGLVVSAVALGAGPRTVALSKSRVTIRPLIHADRPWTRAHENLGRASSMESPSSAASGSGGLG